MIVARTLASAARSCIQRCRQSRGGHLNLRTPCGAIVRSRAAPFDMDRIANVE